MLYQKTIYFIKFLNKLHSELKYKYTFIEHQFFYFYDKSIVQEFGMYFIVCKEISFFLYSLYIQITFRLETLYKQKNSLKCTYQKITSTQFLLQNVMFKSTLDGCETLISLKTYTFRFNN